MSGHIGSSSNLDWNTPHWIRDGLYHVFGGAPDLDPCSNHTSIIGAEANYCLPDHDGLVEPWNVRGEGTKVFVNAPFGKTYMTADKQSIIGQKSFEDLPDEVKATYTVRSSIADWVTKATFENETNGVQVVKLMPASVDTRQWQRDVFKTATVVCMIAGRVRFLMSDGKPGGPCPMAMALVGWLDGYMARRFTEAFAPRGTVLSLNAANDLEQAA